MIAMQPTPATILTALRLSLRQKLNAQGMLTTAKSLQYRKRAAELAQKADKAAEAEQADLLQQALSWIQLAENEEMIAEAEKSVNE